MSVIVLAGGGSRRFGSDKLSARLPDGRSVLEHCLSGMPSAWDLVVVGPSRDLPSALARRVRFVQESPAGGGPLAGIAAGMALVSTDVVALAPGDSPAAGEVLPLLVAELGAAGPDVAAAVLSDTEGQANPLLAAYRVDTVRDAMPSVPDNMPARTLLSLPHRLVPLGIDIADIDTADDLVRFTVPDLGSAPQRRTISADQVRRLVAEQFPQWGDLPVTPVTSMGWDNATFHLGSDMVVRLPTAAEYAMAVEKERHWLPLLAPRLPCPIPTALAHGSPGAGYPFPWSILTWLDGEPARGERIAHPVAFAGELAEFVGALRDIDPGSGPPPGKHNWFRGGTLRTFDAPTQRALTTLDGQIDTGTARELWESLRDVPWDGLAQWFHGDLAPRTILLAEGRLSAVIDFGTCGVGDPACDLAIAWTLLTAEGRAVFRERLDVSSDEWDRGRGWALWKALSTRAATLGDGDAEEAEARRVLAEILAS